MYDKRELKKGLVNRLCPGLEPGGEHWVADGRPSVSLCGVHENLARWKRPQK